MEEKKKKKIECPPESIIYDAARGMKICKETGEVIEQDIIGEEPEWRAYNAEEKQSRSRVGNPLTFTKPDFGSRVDLTPPRESGARRIRGLGGRLGVLQSLRRGLITRSETGIEKNINQALRVLDEFVSTLELPNSVKEDAAKIYREAAHKGLTRGRSIESIVAAALYAACRRQKIPCTLDEMASILRTKGADAKREVAKCYRLLVRDLDLKIPVIEPEQFITRIISELGLPEYLAAEAIQVVRKAKQKGLTAGKDPSGLAAAAVYLAAMRHGFRKTQKEIAQVAGVTEVTVRNRYKEIVKILQEEERYSAS
jgi:transcription initiation factor TFIIB